MSDIGGLTKKLEEDVNKADVWANGPVGASYTAKDGVKVPSIRTLSEKAEINIDQARVFAAESEKSHIKSAEAALRSQEFSIGSQINSGVYASKEEGLANTKFDEVFSALANGHINLYQNKSNGGALLLVEDMTSIQKVEHLKNNSLTLKENRLENINLNDLVDFGVYRSVNDTWATVDNNYPDIKNASGIIEVVNTGNGIIKQFLTTWGGRFFWRTKYSSYDFLPWQEVIGSDKLKMASLFNNTLPSDNLNNVTERGVYRTGSDAVATVDNNYPDIKNANGILEVVESNNLIKQTLTTWYNRTFIRTKYASYDFLPWKEMSAEKYAEKSYQGKTIAWIGDSIVAGNTHPEQVGKILGAKEVIRVGFSSHTMSKYPGSPLGRDKVSMYKIADAIHSGDWSDVISGGEWIKENLNDDKMPMINKLVGIDWKKVDYLVIAFGTNDIYNTNPLGSEYIADPDGETFIGGMCHAIERIESRYPHIQIIFVTPTFRTRQFTWSSEFDINENSDTLLDPNGSSYIEYIDAMKKSEEYYHLPVFDFYRNSGINVRTFNEYLSDGVHPNANGIALWVKKITAFMNAN